MDYSVGWRPDSDVRWRQPHEIGINAIISANEEIHAQNGVEGDQGRVTWEGESRRKSPNMGETGLAEGDPGCDFPSGLQGMESLTERFAVTIKAKKVENGLRDDRNTH